MLAVADEESVARAMPIDLPLSLLMVLVELMESTAVSQTGDLIPSDRNVAANVGFAKIASAKADGVMTAETTVALAAEEAIAYMNL